MRRRLITILVLALGLLLFTAQASLAQSPHFKKNGEPVCTVSHRGRARPRPVRPRWPGWATETS